MFATNWCGMQKRCGNTNQKIDFAKESGAEKFNTTKQLEGINGIVKNVHQLS